MTRAVNAPLRLAGIVLAALALRMMFFSGYPGTDDAHYIEAAYRVSVGDVGAFESYFGARSGLVLPTAAAYAIAGAGPWTTVALPLAASLGGVVVAFLLGQMLFDTSTGLLAALLVAVFPLDVIFATALFACVPVACVTALALYLLLREPRSGRPWLAAAAGTCLGIAMLMADTAWFCLLPLAWFFVFVRPPTRAPGRVEALACFAAIGLVVSGEMVMYLLLTGDPLARWRALLQVVSYQGFDALSSGLGLAYAVQPFLRLVSEQELGLFPLAIVPALAFHVVRRPSRYSVFLVVWVLAIFFYTSYGTTSPFRFAPLPRLPRYLSAVAIPAIVLLASFLMSRRPPVRYAITAALVASSFAGIWVDNGRHAKAMQRDLARFVESRPDARFLMDAWLMFDVLVFTGFRHDPRLQVFAPTEAEARIVADRTSVFGPGPVVRRLDDATDAYIAAWRPEQMQEARAVPGAVLVTTVRRPDRLYIRLLEDPRFMSLLSLLRDRYRVTGLRELASERIEVYRVP